MAETTMEPPRVVEMRITCSSFPWQAQGRFEDGREFYMRFRSCRAQLGVGETFDAAVDETMDPRNSITYHEGNAEGCSHGYCTELEGEEIAYLFRRLWLNRVYR